MITQISIHAPPRGATSAHPAEFAFPPFQFTPLREGRPAGAKFLRQPTFQFTPLREGRLGRCHRVCPAGYFNSRPSARGDADTPAAAALDALFQFTPLREGRRAVARSSMQSICLFQFTPLREGRRRNHFARRPRAISIHAPPRGATSPAAKLSSSAAFQFTPLREGRPERRVHRR